MTRSALLAAAAALTLLAPAAQAWEKHTRPAGGCGITASLGLYHNPAPAAVPLAGVPATYYLMPMTMQQAPSFAPPSYAPPQYAPSGCSGGSYAPPSYTPSGCSGGYGAPPSYAPPTGCSGGYGAPPSYAPPAGCSGGAGGSYAPPSYAPPTWSGGSAAAPGYAPGALHAPGYFVGDPAAGVSVGTMLTVLDLADRLRARLRLPGDDADLRKELKDLSTRVDALAKKVEAIKAPDPADVADKVLRQVQPQFDKLRSEQKAELDKALEQLKKDARPK